MNMTKVCAACKKEKSIESFHIRRSSPDGRNPRCAICVNNYNQIRKEVIKKDKDKSLSVLRLSFPTKDDYHKMFLFLQTLGYDPSKDIHLQFCEKYGLEYKPRDAKNENEYHWEDFAKIDE